MAKLTSTELGQSSVIEFSRSHVLGVMYSKERNQSSPHRSQSQSEFPRSDLFDGCSFILNNFKIR